MLRQDTNVVAATMSPDDIDKNTTTAGLDPNPGVEYESESEDENGNENEHEETAGLLNPIPTIIISAAGEPTRINNIARGHHDLGAHGTSPDSLDHEMNTPDKRDPMHILVLYGLSFIISFIGLACVLAGWAITVYAPLEKETKKWHRMSYERNFWEMQSIVILLTINVFTTSLNFLVAYKGSNNYPDLRDLLILLNTAYDFFAWAALIAFGVVNMLFMLLNREGCNRPVEDPLFEQCEKDMYSLLVVEMIAVNMGILAAVLHFILLIGRCCTCHAPDRRARSTYLRTRIKHEEEMLVELMERRNTLFEETTGLEARRVQGLRLDRPLPAPPSVEDEAMGVKARKVKELGLDRPLPPRPVVEAERARVESRRVRELELNRPLPAPPSVEEKTLVIGAARVQGSGIDRPLPAPPYLEEEGEDKMAHEEDLIDMEPDAVSGIGTEIDLLTGLL